MHKCLLYCFNFNLNDIVFSATDKDSNNAVKLSWDGLKTDGTIADSGIYTIEIDGQDSNEQLYSFINGTVDSIKYSSSGPLAVIGGQELSVSKIQIGIGIAFRFRFEPSDLFDTRIINGN